MPRKRSGSNTKKAPRKSLDIEDDEPLVADDEEEEQLIKSIERRTSLEQQSNQSPRNKKSKTPSPKKAKHKEAESDNEENEPPSAKKHKKQEQTKEATTPKKSSTSTSSVGTPSGLFSKLLKDVSQIPQCSPLKIEQQKEPEISSKDAKKINPDTSAPSLDISEDGMTVTATKDRISIAKAFKPLDRSKDVSYFEVKFSHGKNLSVGLATVNSSTNQLLGSQSNTIGYHSHGGKNAATKETTTYALEYKEGDTIGCGMISKSGQIFFTKNGEFLGIAATIRVSSTYALYPAIGLPEKSTSASINYGYHKFLFNLKKKHFKQFSIKGSNKNPFTGLFVDKIPLPLKGVTGTINIVNFMSEVTVCQEYFNYRNEAVDGLFIAPIDDEATITSFKVTTSENELQAIVVSGTEEDSEVKIIGDVSTTLQALIENIPPMHSIKITLTYMQILAFELNELTFTLPSTVYPHYASSFTNEVYDLDATNLTYDKTGINMTINLWAASPIRHIRTSLGTERAFQREEGVFKLTDKIEKNTFVNDYVLKLGLFETHNSQAVLESDSKHKSTLLMTGFCPFMPFVTKGENEEYIIVIDNSDENLVKVANTSLPVIIKSLPEDCTFNIYTNKPFFKSSKLYTDENVDETLGKEVKKSNNFDINAIIEEILTTESTSNTLKNILLIISDTTNLQPETIDQVEDLCKSRSQRIFPVAIGDSIDKTLIYKLAKAGRGHPSFVPRAEMLLVNTIRQLDRSLRPSFYELEVEFSDPDIEISQQIPTELPTTFHGDCSFLFHEISQHPQGNIYLKGDLYKGNIIVNFSEKFSGRAYNNSDSGTFKSLTEIGSEIEVRTHGKLVRKFSQFYHLKKLYESNNIKEASQLSIKYDIPISGISCFKDGQTKSKKRRTDNMSMRIFLVPGTAETPQQDADRVDRYFKLLSLQRIDGSWELTSELAEILNIELKKTRKFETVQCKVSEEKEVEEIDVVNEKLWATSLATSFMFDYVRFKADENRIVSHKARNYIATYVGKKAIGPCLQESRDYLAKHSKLSLEQ